MLKNITTMDVRGVASGGACHHHGAPPYVAFIIASSLFTIIYSLYQTHTSAVQLHELVKQTCSVTVIRDGVGEVGW